MASASTSVTSSHGTPRTTALLQSFYRHVTPLPLYLSILVPHVSPEDADRLFFDPYGGNGLIAAKLHRLGNALVGHNFNVEPLPCAPRGQEQSLADSSAQQTYWANVLHDVVTQSQAKLLRQQSGPYSNNMLTMGYRRGDDRMDGLTITGSMAMTSAHINTTVTDIMTGHEWLRLFQVIGEQALEHLLTCTSLFVPLAAPAASNMIQVLGESIGEAKGLVPDRHDVDHPCSLDGNASLRRRRKRKRAHTSMDPDEQPPTTKRVCAQTLVKREKTPAEVDLLRSRIFYARPSRSRPGSAVRGLPARHALRLPKIDEAATQQGTASDRLDETRLAHRIRYLCRHIWPREHGLVNVFRVWPGTVKRQTEFEMRASFFARDEEIRRKGRIRTPARLLACQSAIRVMILRNHTFEYRRAMDLCCPSALPRRPLTQAEREGIAADLCESTQVVSTALAEETQHATMALETQFDLQWMSQREVEAPVLGKRQDKPRYTKYRTTHGRVARFVQHVVQRIVPISLFGSQHNLRTVLRAIRTFVSLRRYESVNLQHLCHGFRVVDCQWTLPANRRALRQRPTQAESKKRQDLVHEWIFWLFDALVIPLLRTNFYVTESAKYRNQVLYFRNDVWSAITEPLLDKLKEDRFERVAKHRAVSMMSRRAFGYSFIRLLPKETGMRPIVNLRRRSVKIDRKANQPIRKVERKLVKGKKGKRKTVKKNVASDATARPLHSINQTMNATFQVLNFEKQDNPASIGSSVFGPQDIFDKLCRFKERLVRQPDGRPSPLFFVKMDVVGAFDCIDQAMLLDIVRDVVRHDRYVIQRYTRMNLSNGQPTRLWPRVACAEEEQEPFALLAQHLAQTQAWRDTILADGVVYAGSDRDSLLWLLHEHIQSNLVKVGKEFCRQKIGIPQGSTLSTLLCCYYLARMESELGLDGLDDADSPCLLMRYTDDFLFITSDVHLARRFFQMVHEGSARFHCAIAPEKTLTNFQLFSPSMTGCVAQVAMTVQQTVHAGIGDQEQEWFPWCSYRICPQTLAVRYDLQRYRFTCVADSLTVPLRSPFGTMLRRTIVQTVQRRNLAIYLDVALNGIQNVLFNIHQAYVVATCKWMASWIELGRRFGHRNAQKGFLLQCVLSNVEHGYAHACGKMAQSLLSQGDTKPEAPSQSASRWPISPHAYRWIALHAIVSTFALLPSMRKMDVYRELCCQVQKAHRAVMRNIEAGMDKDSLEQQARASWQHARPILRTMNFRSGT